MLSDLIGGFRRKTFRDYILIFIVAFTTPLAGVAIVIFDKNLLVLLGIGLTGLLLILLPPFWLLSLIVLTIPFDNFNFISVFSLSDILEVLLALRLMMDLAVRRVRFRFNWTYIFSTLLVVWIFISSTFANDPKALVSSFNAIAMVLFFPLVLNYCVTNDKIFNLLKMRVLANIIMVTLAFVQLFFWYAKGEALWHSIIRPVAGFKMLRLTGSYNDPNFLALYLLPGLLLSLFFARTKDVSPTWQRIARVALWLGVAVYILTISRAGWLVLLLFVAYRWLLKPAFKVHRFLRPVLLFIALVAGGGVVYYFLGYSVSLNPYSVDNRLKIMQDSLSYIAENPSMGYGMAGYLDFATFYEKAGWLTSGHAAHNTYLDLALRAGVPALLLFSILIMLVLWYTQMIRKKGEGVLRSIGMVLQESFIFQLIFIFTLSALFRKDIWFVMAMLLTLSTQVRCFKEQD